MSSIPSPTLPLPTILLALLLTLSSFHSSYSFLPYSYLPVTHSNHAFITNSPQIQRAPCGVITTGMQGGKCGGMYGRQPTSLYNLFDRFSRVAKANLNNIAKKLEDPEKIMTQALEDMQGDLVKVRQSYAEVTASVRRLSKEMDVSVKMSGEWRTRAETALRAGEEELAKEALQRRQVAEEKAETLRAQIETQEASLGKLKEGMELLEGKILESKVSRRKGGGEPRELRE